MSISKELPISGMGVAADGSLARLPLVEVRHSHGTLVP